MYDSNLIKLEFNALAIRDYYPSNEQPTNSLWVYEQVFRLKDYGLNSLVLSPTPFIPKFFKNTRKFYKYPTYNKNIEKYKGTYVIRYPYLKLPSNYFLKYNTLILNNIIKKYLNKINPLIVHAHFGRNGVAAIKECKKRNIPLVTFFYGDDVGVADYANKLSQYYSYLKMWGNLFIALSIDMRNDLINMGFPPEKTIVHHLGIDLNNFKPPSQKKENEKIIFLCVGRFHKYKGGQDCIRAFAKLSVKYQNIQLRIVGDGPYIDHLKRLSTELNIKDKVIFINNFQMYDPRKVVLDEMANADIFVFTPFESTNGMKTGTPVVLMEAQAMKLPCIATDHAGIPEVLDFGNSGILVKQRDIKQIACKMEELINDKEKRVILGIKGRDYIEREFNLDKQIYKLSKIYNNLINNK